VRRQLERTSAWVTDGADLNRRGLARNQGLRGEALRYDILDRRPEFAGRYDFVLLFDVIEHIAETRPFLDAVVHHLRPGGWLFVNVPAVDRLRSSFDRVIGHLRRYDRRTLGTELASHGLDLRDVRYWGFSMLPYLVFRKLMSGRTDPPAAVIRRGVLPPQPWMNRWILRLMAIETAWLPRPALGTSLLAAAVRTR
jgi:SAM-dependent methyltransferase